MGAGDWIMATSQVRALQTEVPLPVLVVDRVGRPQWHEVFENNPRIIRRPNQPHQRLVNASGLRPYIAGKSARQWSWSRWPIAPGEIYLTDTERAFAEPYRGMVMVEPNVKENAHRNKAWRWERWQTLADLDLDPMVQCGPNGVRRLVGPTQVITPTFRHACAVLSVCRAFVGCEGGLHHAAAALGVPAVVLFSEFISPEITGYPQHRNIRHAGEPCGSRITCAGCDASMAAITVGEVVSNLMGVLH